MDMEDKKPFCPVLDVDGVISGGKQFDLDITLPEDNRDVIYGVIKNCFKEPVCDAVVKLTEIVYNCGKEKRRLLVILSQTKKENLFLVLFALIENMLFKFGQILLKK